MAVPLLLQVEAGSESLGNTSEDFNLVTTLTDITRAIMFFSARSNSDRPSRSMVTGEILSTTQIRYQRPSGVGDPVANHYIAEFSQGITVDRGEILGSATADNLFTAAVGAVDLTKTFVVASMRTTGSTANAQHWLRARMSDDETFEGSIDSGSNTDSNSVCAFQVIEGDEGLNVTSGDIVWGSGEASKAVSDLVAVNPNKTMLLTTNSTPAGTGNDMAQKNIDGDIDSPTSLLFTRDATGQAMDSSWFRVEWLDGTRVQKVTVTMADTVATDNETLDAVDLAKTFAIAGGWMMGGGRTGNQTNDTMGSFSNTLDLSSTTNLLATRANTTEAQTFKVYVVELNPETGLEQPYDIDRNAIGRRVSVLSY